jgi:hypothetical protein
MDTVADIRKLGARAKGRGERIKALEGIRLTRDEAIMAHCYDCMGGYTDGNVDCEMSTCSLYSYMPYREAQAQVI